MIINSLKNIYKKINGNHIHSEVEKMPFEEQIKYLNHFPEPKDDYERSYYKYRCYCEYNYYKKAWIIFLYNIGAMIILPFLHIKQRHMRIKNTNGSESYDAVIENVPRLPNGDIVPIELLTQYKKVKEIKDISYSDAMLGDVGEDLYRELRKRYFFSFYFRLINLMKIGQFSKYIELYNPKVIAFYSCEREFSGPLVSLLCEKCNSKYIAFMHGDYLASLSFAFQRYSQYYIWDKLYQKMFISLRCVDSMIIYTPPKMQSIVKTEKAKDDCDYFAAYYFSNEDRAEAEKINAVFLEFQRKGLKTKVRPHPRFSDVNMLRSIFTDIPIEDTTSHTISESIEETYYIVGLNTTVLTEAYFSNKIIVIDDVSSTERFIQLNNRGYIAIKREHKLLSELFKEVQGT